MSVVASELKAKFSADLTELEAGFKHAQALQSQFVSQSSAIKVSPLGSGGEIAASFKSLDVAVKGSGEALSKYKFESTEAATATAKLKAAQLENTQATIVGKTQIQALRQEKGELALATSQARLRMLEFKESQQQVKGSSDNLLKSLGGLKGLLGAGAGLAVIGFGKEAITSFTEFENKLKEIQAVSSVTGDEMQKLKDRAIELGEKFPTSATEAAAGFAELSKAGFSANEVLQSSMALLTLSTAGQLDMARSSEILAGSIRGFGLAATDAQHVVDLLAQTANQSSVDLTDMGESFKYVAPAAQAAGFGIDDVSIALGLMGNSMIKGSEAGTSLRSMITGLTAPTAEGANALADLGVQVEGAGGKVKPFRTIITDLRGAFTTLGQADQIDFAKKIVGKEAMSGFLSIIRASDKDFATMTDAIDHADGAAKKMSDTMSSGLGGKLTNLSGSLDTAKIKIGESLSGPMGKAVDAINSAVPGFTKFSIALLEKIVPAVEAAVKILKPLGDTLGFIGDVLDKITPKVDEVSKKFDTAHFGETLARELDYATQQTTEWGVSVDDASKKLAAGQITSGEAIQKTQVIADLSYSKMLDYNKRMQQEQGGWFPSKEKISAYEELYGQFKKNYEAASEFTKKIEHPVYGGSEIKDFTGALEGASKNGLDPATAAMKRMADASGTTVGQIKFLNDEVKRLGDAASTSSKEMNEASSHMKVMDDIALKLGPGVEDLWKQYKTFGEKAAEGGVGQDKWNTAAEQAKDKLIALNPKMADVIKAYDSSKEKLRTSTDAFHDNTISMVLNEGQLTNISAAGDKARDSIAKTGDATGKAAQVARSHVGEWSTAGAMSVQGFIDAIQAGANRAAQAAANVASGAASATRQKLKIESPSKVFEEIGQFMMKGWELGIDKNGDAVIGKVASTFSGVMSAVKTGVEAINAVSTFQGMNNAAANQFIFDSTNFLTVFGTKAQGFSEKWLEATSKYASGLGAGLGILKGGVEGLNSLKDYGGMSNSVMNQFANDANNTLLVFSAFAVNFDVVALQSTQLYAESLGKVVGTIEPAVKGISSLKDYPGLIEANLIMLVKDSVIVVRHFQDEAGNFNAEALVATGVYAEGVGKIVSSISGTVAGLAALANAGDLKRVAPTVVAGIVEDVKLTSTLMGEASALMSGEVIKKTGDFSDMSKKVTDSLSGSIKFFEDVTKMGDISGTWQSIGLLVDNTTDAVLYMSAASLKLDKEGTAGAERFATTTGKVFDGLKKVIDTAQAASGLKGGLSGIMDPFLADLDLTYLKIAELNTKAGNLLAISLETSGKMVGSTKALSDGFASQQALKSYLPGSDTNAGGAAPALPAPIPLSSAFGGGANNGGGTGSGITINFQTGSIVISGSSKESEEDIRKVVRKIFEEEGQAYLDRQRAAGARL